jgi:secreted trypsin-like serine protease
LNSHRIVAAVAVALALLAASETASSAGPAGPAIVGGTPASPGEYPAQGWLLINLDADPDFEAECGGSLVGSRWFLTAAHCAIGATGFAVLLGDVDVTAPNNDWYDVVGADVKAGYNGLTGQDDVAMLKLGRPAPYQPLRVIGTNESSSWGPGTLARIVGWGTTSEGGNPSDLLLKADVPIVADSTCSTAYAVHAPPMDPNTMVCAGDGVHDTCQGDSGGPLMVRDAGGNWALAGITSWGEGCANPSYPGVYTRIGAPDLNAWVAARYPRALFTVGPASARETTVFTSTSFHPESDGFTSFDWDLNGDGLYQERSAPTANWIFTTAGPHEVGLRASRPGGDTAVVRRVIMVNAPPTAELGRARTVREGGRIVLSASGRDAEGQPLTYAWDLDGKSPFDYTTPGPNPTYSAVGLDGPGNRGISLQACDPVGACSRDFGVIHIANVRPRVNAGPNRRVKRQKRVRFRVRASDPGPDRLTATWRFGDGTRAFRGFAVKHAFRRAGRYQVKVRVVDDDKGARTDTLIVRVRR